MVSTRAEKAAQRSAYYKWIILAMGTLVVFGALGLARFGYTMVLPAMQGDLGLDNSQAGLLASANLGGYLTLSLVGGALASRYGVRVVAALGLSIAGAGMIFTGLAHGFWPLAVWRGLTGIGSGAGNIAIMGLWAAWFARNRRGLAAGIAVSGSSIALIFTGLFVPWVIREYGVQAWRICWMVFGWLTLLLAAGSFLIVRNNPGELGLPPVDEDAGRQEAGPGAVKPCWKDVYLSSSVWRLGFIYVAFGFSYIIYMTFFVKSLISDSGYTAAEAGRLFMAMGWFSLLCGLLWGAVSDAIGRRNTLIVLYLIHCVAFGLFALGDSHFLLIISASVFGLSAWSIPAVMAAACGDMLGPDLAPAALGFITLFFGLGQALGPVVGGMLADAFGSFGPAFLLASAAALLGAAGSGFLLKNAVNH